MGTKVTDKDIFNQVKGDKTNYLKSGGDKNVFETFSDQRAVFESFNGLKALPIWIASFVSGIRPSPILNADAAASALLAPFVYFKTSAIHINRLINYFQSLSLSYN